MMIVRYKDGNREEKVSESKRDNQKLSDEKIIELADLCQKIENHYGHPQDIEWLLYEDKLYIVQSRPITTLKK